MKFNTKYIPYIIIIILLLLLGFFYQRTQSLKLQARVDSQNLIAKSDSITLEYNKKTDEWNASKAGFISRENDLSDLNEELARRVKNSDGKIVTLNYTVFQLRQDTTILRDALRNASNLEPPKQLNDSTFNIPWELYYVYDTANYDLFKGVTQIVVGGKYPLYKVNHNYSELLFRESQIDLTFGQKIENDQLRVFINSKYPGFSPQQLEGVLIDPNTNPYIKKLMKKRHWFTGFGVGPSINLGYDFLNARPAVILGVGIQYNIYEW